MSRENVEIVRHGYEVFNTTATHRQAVVRLRGSGRASGAGMDQPIYVLWALRDGKIARCAVFRDRSQALEAAGASD